MGITERQALPHQVISKVCGGGKAAFRRGADDDDDADGILLFSFLSFRVCACSLLQKFSFFLHFFLSFDIFSHRLPWRHNKIYVKKDEEEENDSHWIRRVGEQNRRRHSNQRWNDFEQQTADVLRAYG